MKYRIFCIALLCLFAAGCGFRPDSTSSADKSASIKVKAQAPSDALRIAASNTTLRVGDTGFITIQGKPGAKYTIQTSYVINGKILHVTQLRTANADGQATFNWVVNPGTALGTYSGVISGGGQSITISHTVIK